ncbi:uncharacterized protein LOC127763773 [Oryza glaberrima]|uniref:uncharacterized protein LOC127763773 n=1 Tax=Oryza glaberrima TaxID=4538 RepID=UPI00224C603A|nr:uncharacterized protein LOC127763773 [Oryza glaberrima]
MGPTCHSHPPLLPPLSTTPLYSLSLPSPLSSPPGDAGRGGAAPFCCASRAERPTECCCRARRRPRPLPPFLLPLGKGVLNVYDLSNSLARQLSTSFLRKPIEAIWHTGVLVYGNKYLYGGGIQSLPVGRTPYGRPVRVVEPGVTHIPR